MRYLVVVAVLISCSAGRFNVRFPDGSEEASLHVCHREAPGEMWCLDFFNFQEYLRQQGRTQEGSGLNLTPDPTKRHEL